MAVDIGKTVLRTLASLGVVFPAHFFDTLQAAYLQQANEAIDQYAADAILNGLPYERHEEGQAVENFTAAVRQAGQEFQQCPTDAGRLPAWNRVMSALPDFLDRLSTVVTDENRHADQTLLQRQRAILSVETPQTTARGQKVP